MSDDYSRASTANAPGEARLRKNRNQFTVHPEPSTKMSATRFIDTATYREPAFDVEHFADWFLGKPSARERFRWTLRDSLDELLDGQRTGRWCYQHLTKTEKTYLGTAVEINFTREFEIPDGYILDWRIDGRELDCKFSKDFGGWEIPMEMYRCPDHGDQSGTDDHPALLLWMDDDHNRWSAGLIRVADSMLGFRPDGSRAYNRDNKRKLSKRGLSNISWLWEGVQTDLPENTLLHMTSAIRRRILAPELSGQQRVNNLLRETQGQLINRATILTVAQQDDPMKRARDARLPRNLGSEGILVLGHQEADPHIAALLGLPVPAKGEVVSYRVVPVEQHDHRPKVYLAGRWWAGAAESDPLTPAPPRKEYNTTSLEELRDGPLESGGLDAMATQPLPSSPSVSRRMSRQATKNTQPELAIRRRLHRAGLRYRVDYAPVKGLRRRADIVFASQKVAVFVDGCFWHSCPEHATRPAANAEWWSQKLQRNRERDDETNRILEEAGWTVIRVWEHEDPELVAETLAEVVRSVVTRADSPSALPGLQEPGT